MVSVVRLEVCEHFVDVDDGRQGLDEVGRLEVAEVAALSTALLLLTGGPGCHLGRWLQCGQGVAGCSCCCTTPSVDEIGQLRTDYFAQVVQGLLCHWQRGVLKMKSKC